MIMMMFPSDVCAARRGDSESAEEHSTVRGRPRDTAQTQLAEATTKPRGDRETTCVM